MKFEEFLKIKGKVHESEIADLLKDTDRLIESYSYNNGEVLNESMEDIFKGVMSMVSYTQAMAKIEDYKEKEFAADQKGLDALFAQKVKPLVDKIAAMTEKKNQVSNRQQKEALTKQIDALNSKKDDMDSQKELIKQQKDNEKEKLGEELKDLETAMLTPFKELWEKTKSEALRGVKLKIAELAAQQAKETKDPARIQNREAELKTIKANYEEAKKKLEDAENASEEDIKQLEGVKDYMTEILAFRKAGQDLGIQRKTLEGYYNKAKASVDASESATDSKYIDFDYLTEEEKKETIDPTTVLSKINAIPETYKDSDGNAQTDEENIKTKKELLGKLKEAAPKFVTALTDQVKAKKALWDAVKKADSVTKDLIEIAGGDPSKATEVKDGDKVTGYKAGEATKKWAAAFNKVEDYEPLQKLSAGMEFTKKDETKATKGGSIEDAIDAAVANLPEVKEPEKTKEKTPAEKIQDLTDKSFDQVDVTDPEATKSVDIKDDQGNVTSTEDKPKWKKGGEVEGKKYYKELLYDDKGKATNESQHNTFKSKVLEKNSRIVPTFESYIHSRGLK